MTQSGGQAAGIQLQVGLDLAYFRAQMQKVSNIASSEFTSRLDVRFNKRTLDAELNNLQRAIKRRVYRVEIGGNLSTLPGQIENLRKQLASLEDTKIDVGIGAVKSLSKKDAQKIKTDLRQSVLGEDKKIFIPVSIKPSITREDVRNFKNTVKSKLTGLSIDVKANVKGGGFAGTEHGYAGLMEHMQKQGLLGKVAPGMTMRMGQNGGDLSQELNEAVKSAEKIKSIFDGVAKSIATTGKLTANVQGKRLGLSNVPLMTGSLEKRVGRSASLIEGTLSSETLKLLYPEINKTISSLAALRGQVQQNTSKLSGFGLIIGLAAFAGVPLAKSIVKLTGSANNFAKLLDSLGPKLEGAFTKAASNILNIASGRLLGGGSLAGLLPAAYRGIGPAAEPAGLLPPAYRGIGPSRNAGALPPAYRGLPFGFDFKGLPPESSNGGAGGGLALSPDLLKGRVDEILRNYFKVIEVRVRNAFDIIGDYHKNQLNTFIGNYKKTIDQYHRNVLISAARQQVRNVQVSELPQRPAQAMLSGARVAGLLSPEPTGRYRSDASAETQAQLFARREREARMRSAERETRVLSQRGGVLPGTTFMGDDFVRGGGRDRVTGSGQPRERGGALAFLGGGMGPSSSLGAGYFEVGKGLQLIKQAYAGVKPFLDTKKLPLSGAMAELGDEFGTAIKQVLLYGTAYKALAFFTSLPGQAFEAAKGLATYRNQLKAVTSESQTFDQSLAFVDNLAQRFNVPLDSARQGFVKLYASMQPAGFGQKQIEGLFTGISKAAAAFGLSADKVDRVNYAFAQMASKGQIMSEELKGQLGDVLPGALGLFAEAAQMSIPEFSKAMEDGAFKGKAMEQVLDNVAILMNNKFGPAAQGAAKTLQGAVNQIQNNLALMYESFGPIVDRFAAIFGPQVNSLIKDITETMTVLTGTFTAAGEGLATLSPRAQAFYAAIQSLTPPLQQAGVAIADLGSRFATLLPAIVQATAAAISFASSPLGRGAIIASVAIGTLTAAIKLLEVTGLKAAMKAVYLFIGGLLKIPPATGVARAAIIGLKLALTGVFAGAILLGLDFLVGKLFNIGDAANDSAKDIRGMRKELDAMAGASDVEGTSQSFLGATSKLATARAANQKALDELKRAKARPEGDTLSDINKGVAVANAQKKVDQTYSKVIEAQKELQATERSRANAVALKERQDKETQGSLTKIDLSGGDGDSRKPKEKSLESYYSLQDTLAKNFTQAEIDRLEAEHQHKVDLIKAEYDLKELRANGFQKDALKFERRMAEIALERQGALLKASNAVLAAQGSVANGVAGGLSTTGATGLLQGSTGVSSGAHFDIRRADGSFISPEQARALLDPAVRRQVTTTSAYGPRRAPVPGASTFHRGVDLAGPANTPLNLAPGYSMVGQGEEGGLGYAASVRGPQGEMYKVGHLQRPKAVAGAARKVPGSEKRDIVADQKTQLEQVKQSAAARQAEAKAIKDAEVALADFVATATPVEEQKLQNDLLKRRTDLMMQGYSDSAVDQALKFAEAEYKVNFALKLNEELERKGVRTKADADAIAKQMTEGLTAYSSALEENTIRLRDNQLAQAMTVLKDRMAMAGAMTPDQELREQIRQRNPSFSPEQQEGLFQQEKLVQDAEKLKADLQGIAGTIGDAFGNAFKGIITGSMSAREALAGFFQSVADSFADMVAKMIAEYLKMALIKGIMSLIPGLGAVAGGLGGGGESLGASSSAVFGLNSADMNQYSSLMPMANGGVLSGGFQAFANGGIVTGPTLGLVGEGRYNEAVIPLPDGKSVPVDLGGAMGNQITSNIVVNVSSDGKTSSSGAGSDSAGLGRKIEGAVKQVIVGELRPGGLLAGRR
jgi:tape measure domain-containing protein